MATGATELDDYYIRYAELNGGIERAERLRRRGMLIMYGPVFGLGLLLVAGLCAAAFLAGPNRGGSAGRLQSWLMVLSVVPLVVSLIAAPVGVVMRVVGSRRLKKLERALEESDEEPPAWPPVRSGDLIGSWRVLRAEDGLVSLRREPIPWALHALGRRTIVPFFIGMPVAIVVGMATTGNTNQAGAGALMMLLVQGWFAQRALRVERFVVRRTHEEEDPELEYTCTRPYFLPTERIARPVVRFIARGSPVDLLFVYPSGAGMALEGFSGGAAGRWQAGRLAEELALRLGFFAPAGSEDGSSEEDGGDIETGAGSTSEQSPHE